MAGSSRPRPRRERRHGRHHCLDASIGRPTTATSTTRAIGRPGPHADIDEYDAVRDCYHLVIDAPAGTEFIAGDEQVVMEENELWWFDNKKRHCVRNVGARVHLVFDLLLTSGRAQR
jgi:hypothetical protein